MELRAVTSCKKPIGATSLILAMLISFSTAGAYRVHAQDVLPATDGTGTIVELDGNRFDIHGGTLSGDQANLFHSFEQFGLSSRQVANFLSSPHLQNILGRVVGGDSSIINGLIQVSGGNSNLFLMNPAGIVFGPNAQLNVPADFVATTATAIGFEESEWFSSAGANDHQKLNGSPSQFAFALDEGGSVINAGRLSVSEGKSLTLLGGTVANTGELKAPEGTITLAAVPGTNRVRIGQEGSLLSFEFVPPEGANGAPLPIRPLDLAVLLTEGAKGIETGLRANADGSVQLTQSGVTIPAEGGTTIASGTLDTSGDVGGDIHILGDKVGVIAADVDASGTNGGGTVLVGGDYKGQGMIPTASRTVVSSGTVINAEASEDGDGGKVIVWSGEVTQFGGNIRAGGGSNSGDGGFVEVSGKQDLVFRGSVDLSATKGAPGTLILDPANITVVDGSALNDNELSDDQILAGDSPGASFEISDVALEGLAANANVILEATNDITIGNLFDNELTLQTDASGSVRFTADSDQDGVGSFSGAISDTIQTQGGALTIEGADVSGSLSIITNGGDITVRSGTDVDLDLFSNSASGVGGNITVDAAGDIFLTGLPLNLDSSGPLGAGAIRITSALGSVDMGNADSTSVSGAGGEITVAAASDISTGALDSSGFLMGGNVSLTSANGSIRTDFATEGFPLNPIDSSSANGAGGDVTLSAGASLLPGGIDASGLTGGGRILLAGNEIELTGGPASVRSPGADLLIMPADIGQSLVLGGPTDSDPASSETQTLDLTVFDLAALEEGFRGVTFGRGGGSGAITIASGGLLIGDPIQFQSSGAGASFEVNGPIDTSGNDLTLVANGPITINADITTDGGAITISSDDVIDSSGGILDSSSSGSGGAISLTGGSSVTSSSIFANAFGEFEGDGGVVDVTAEGDILVGEISTASFGTGQGGVVNLTSNSGSISAGLLDSFSSFGAGGAATLSAVGSIVIDSTILGSQSAPGSGALTINTPGEISFTEVVTPHGADIVVGNLTPPSSISLLSGLDTLGGSVNLAVNGDIDISSFITTDGGDFTIESTGAVTMSGLVSTAGGLLRIAGLSVLAPEVSFDSSNPDGAGGDIELSATSVDGIVAGSISTVSDTGPGGAISLTSAGSISAASVEYGSTAGLGGRALTANAPGAISLGVWAPNGADTVVGNVTGPSGLSIPAPLDTGGGNVDLTVDGDLEFIADVSTGGGDFTINSSGAVAMLGPLSTGGVTISTGGGAISVTGLSVLGDLVHLDSSNPGSEGGNIELTASSGGVDMGDVNSSGSTGGSVLLDAEAAITTGVIDTSGSSGNGGSLTAFSGGAMTLGGIVTTSSGALGGAINLTGGDSIGVASVAFGSAIGLGGGALTANAPGEVDFAGGLEPNGANIVIGDSTQPSGISLPSDLNTSGGSFNLAVNGDFDLQTDVTTNGGDFTVESLGAISASSPVLTNGGLISFAGLSVLAPGVTFDSSNPNGVGGDISLTASSGGLETGVLDSSGITGGTVSLTAGGDIEVAIVDAQGDIGGTGGNVEMATSGFFRATSSFIDQDGTAASISTSGGPDGGNVDITHGGGGVTPFVVGDATTNGTAAAITSGSFTLANRTLLFTFQEGNLTVISVDEPPNAETVLQTIPEPIPEIPDPVDLPLPLPELEDRMTHEYEDYLTAIEEGETRIRSLTEIREVLNKIEDETGVKPAILYAAWPDVSARSSTGCSVVQEGSRLQLLLVTTQGIPIQKEVEGATHERVTSEAAGFLQVVRNPSSAPGQYLPRAEQLYKWLVAPMDEELRVQGIETLVFVMDCTLRSLPIAALHDGQQFLVQKYSMGLVPSLSLVDARYVDVRNLGLLAMGATEFTDQNNLPGVETELNNITRIWSPDESEPPLLNEDFTEQNLVTTRTSRQLGIVHLATHANFQTGGLSNSYIQFWRDKLGLDQVRQLGLHDPPVELMTLSACMTAVGDPQAELGFAGFAAQAGVKSAVGSLWSVDDMATMGLMTRFYSELREAPIKAQALRRAQLALLEGSVRLDSGDLTVVPGRHIPVRGLKLVMESKGVEVPETGVRDFKHPFYWSGFTMIGSPW